ncbi:hypothetical protein E2562_025580 [Oryza meyeriana var. granulata]|uniref:Uncharacterized protein n=1 Tax=Oryza meyeriana var. granulata TaxID=110450 RepID=A0A6G1E259_9ORYZ|nr:hypothetical protein E2562_025580 [Oryza meyeriana var. granulata]
MPPRAAHAPAPHHRSSSPRVAPPAAHPRRLQPLGLAAAAWLCPEPPLGSSAPPPQEATAYLLSCRRLFCSPSPKSPPRSPRFVIALPPEVAMVVVIPT